MVQGIANKTPFQEGLILNKKLGLKIKRFVKMCYVYLLNNIFCANVFM
jgi:hypothetical protein